MRKQFRIFNKIDKIMQTPNSKNHYQINIKLNGDIVAFDEKGISRDSNEFILMQYTGKRDKNGFDICEGDICERRYVLTPEKKFMFVVNNKNFGLLNGIDLEIIDNIYKNPILYDKFVDDNFK